MFMFYVYVFVRACVYLNFFFNPLVFININVSFIGYTCFNYYLCFLFFFGCFFQSQKLIITDLDRGKKKNMSHERNRSTPAVELRLYHFGHGSSFWLSKVEFTYLRKVHLSPAFLQSYILYVSFVPEISTKIFFKGIPINGIFSGYTRLWYYPCLFLFS